MGMNVLVLNISYQPLSVVGHERAISLLMVGKAEIVHSVEGIVFRSEKQEIPLPSVIRLMRMVQAPHTKEVPLSRRALFARDKYTCGYCGGHADTVDHVIPRAQGGQNVWTNVTSACQPCNAKKADRTPEEAGMKLTRKPYAPTRAKMIATRGSDDWIPYLGNLN